MKTGCRSTSNMMESSSPNYILLEKHGSTKRFSRKLLLMLNVATIHKRWTYSLLFPRCKTHSRAGVCVWWERPSYRCWHDRDQAPTVSNSIWLSFDQHSDFPLICGEERSHAFTATALFAVLRKNNCGIRNNERWPNYVTIIARWSSKQSNFILLLRN